MSQELTVLTLANTGLLCSIQHSTRMGETFSMSWSASCKPCVMYSASLCKTRRKSNTRHRPFIRIELHHWHCRVH